MNHYAEQTVEVSETIEVTLGIEFDAVAGCPGDYFTPADPGYIEVTGLEVGTLIGATWEKSGRELRASGWLDFLLATRAMKKIEDRIDLDRLAEQASTEEYDPY